MNRIRRKVRVWATIPLALLVAGCSVLGLGTPTVTPTLFPTFTPPPSDTPIPPTPDYIYQDSFTDPASGWPTVNTDTTKAGYHPPDAYHLEVKATDTAFWITRQQDFGDFSAELQVYLENASDTGQWRHGLVFRATAEDRFYAFMINPRAQAWAVAKRTAPAAANLGHLAAPAALDSAWQTLAEGTNPTIVADLKAVNTLRVDAQGPNMTFSINGQGVVALTDAEFGSGDFGFVVETHDATLAHVHFDILTVRAFDPAKVPAAPTVASTPTPSPTPTETPTPTKQVQQGQPTLSLTDISGTAAVVGTLSCGVGGVPCPAGTFIPGVATLACGLPGFPCP